MRNWKAGIAGTAAVLAALLLAAWRSAPAEAQPGMFEQRTEHYAVQTDISPEFTTLVGQHMEEIFKEYSRRFRDYGKAYGRFDVAVFSTDAAYREAVPQDVWGSMGAFVPGKNLLAAHADGRTPEEVFRTLYHEGFHQFMFSVVAPNCPIWLNEGLAEYFSEATWRGPAEGFEMGLVPSQPLFVIQQAIRNGTSVPFADLFALNPESWLRNVRNDPRRAALYYAEAWSIVQFLVHADNGRYTKLLVDYLKEINQGQNQERAFRSIFGRDLGAFEKVWADAVLSLTPSPKFLCRDNMEALLLLTKMVYGDPRSSKGLENLRWQVLRVQRLRWEITRPNGEKISSDDEEQVAQLFRCPLDGESHGISYLTVRNVETGLPLLVCTHHPGIIIKAYYVPAPDGDLKVKVEEEVRETVSADLAEAIRQAGP